MILGYVISCNFPSLSDVYTGIRFKHGWGCIVITLNSLSKVYRTAYMETTALQQVNLHIGKGEFVAVMGPSGCGKSTLLNVVGMIDSATDGEYWFDGEEIASRSENELVDLRKKNIGFIFQNFNLIDDLSVEENVDLPLLYLGLAKAERREKVAQALELVGLGARAKHKPQELSGGQQQRVAVARSVVGDPKLILADEPTGNLDTKNGDDVMNMLNKLKANGTTILMVTHSPEHGERADRIITMLDGEVVGAENTSHLSVVGSSNAVESATGTTD